MSISQQTPNATDHPLVDGQTEEDVVELLKETCALTEGGFDFGNTDLRLK